jgi:3-oxosteroid 1-dehydrogenase
VTVFERAPVFGGTTSMSGGGMWLPNSRLAIAAGYDDSTTQVETYLRKVTHGTVAADLIHAFAENAPTVIDLLEAAVPTELELTDTPDYHADFAGAKSGGRQVSASLYERKRLGEYADLIRPLPPGGIPPLRHCEQQAAGWGVGPQEGSGDLAALADARHRNGIVGRGQALVGALMEACLAHGVELIPSARVIDLIDDGRISGVTLEREGVTERVAASAVIIASGGFEWNADMWVSFVGVPLDGPLSPPTIEGDGIKMAYRAGARLANMQHAWWCPAVKPNGDTIDGRPVQRFFNFSKSFPGAIAVNRKGRRFANEAMNYHDFGGAMAQFDTHAYEFPNLPTWVVMDEQHVRVYGIDKMGASFGEDWLVESGGLDELAERVGIDREGLVAQVATFNESAVHGVDPVFHRGETAWEVYRADPQYQNPTVRELNAGLAYAYRQTLGVLGTNGGASVDARARVLDLEGKPITGLFAAGNAAASPFGRAYPGGGATLGSATTLGLIAGTEATR